MKNWHIIFLGLVIAVSTVSKMSAETILPVQAKSIFQEPEQLELLAALSLGEFKRAGEILGKEDVNAIGVNGETALWWQANVGNFSAFDYLLENGASPILQVLNSSNTLELAAAQPDPRFLKAAIARGANVNMISQFEHGTPLLMAVQHRNKANVEVLIEAGACVNIADTMGTTPLLWALEMKAFDIGLLLLKNGASPAFKNRQGHDAQASLREANVDTGDPEYESFIEVKKFMEKQGQSKDVRS